MNILYINDVDLELLDKQRVALNDLLSYLRDAKQDNYSYWVENLSGVVNLLNEWSDDRYYKQTSRERYLKQIVSCDSPMTTNQATARYECSECRIGMYCSRDCVADRTGSQRCSVCNGRVWFNREYPKRGTMYRCPYCENDQVI